MTTKAGPILDHILAWSLDRPLAIPYRYIVATLLVVAIAVIRVMLVTSLVPWLLFIPAIVAVALVFGKRVGVYMSVLAMIAAALTIGDRSQPWFLTGPQWSGSFVFLAVTVLLARVIGELRLVYGRARRLNIRLEERQAFLSSVLASSTDCIKVVDLDGRLTFMSDGGMKVMEIENFDDVKGCPWPDFWQGSGNVEASNAIAAARAGRASNFIGKADTFAGTPKWWDVSVSPIPGPDGRPERILSVSRDRTELIEAQAQRELLNEELGHRLKNVLSLVQSVANQTFRQSSDVQTAHAAFASRLAALGKATDILTSTAWHSATLHDVVAAGMASVGEVGGRVHIDGPAIRLDSQAALALTLALHELTTNACKYGAFATEEGTISLTWRHEPADQSPDARFTLVWQEKDGPPVTPPTRKGFGSKMIERSLQSYFRGETSLTFDPEGVVFRIDAPLPASGGSAA